MFRNVSLISDTGVCSLRMIRVNCYFERACRYDESLGAYRLSRFYKLSGAIIGDGDRKSWDSRGPMIWDNRDLQI